MQKSYVPEEHKESQEYFDQQFKQKNILEKLKEKYSDAKSYLKDIQSDALKIKDLTLENFHNFKNLHTSDFKNYIEQKDGQEFKDKFMQQAVPLTREMLKNRKYWLNWHY